MRYFWNFLDFFFRWLQIVTMFSGKLCKIGINFFPSHLYVFPKHFINMWHNIDLSQLSVRKQQFPKCIIIFLVHFVSLACEKKRFFSRFRWCNGRKITGPIGIDTGRVFPRRFRSLLFRVDARGTSPPYFYPLFFPPFLSSSFGAVFHRFAGVVPAKTAGL